MGGLRANLSFLTALAAAALRVVAAESGKVPPEDRVLHCMVQGLNAFRRSEWSDAERYFDEALVRIQQYYADSAAAERARSLWYSEGRKTFLGEPYERAMVFFYRGLLYWHSGDLDNARAAFRGGQIQDAFAEEEQFRCDFALLLYLDAILSGHFEDVASVESLRRAWSELKPSLPPPETAQRFIILAEAGGAPRKIRDGIGGERLLYRRARTVGAHGVRVRLAGSDMVVEENLWSLEDLFFQASTRGGRAVDHILKGKAAFRDAFSDQHEALSALSGAGMITASVVSGRRSGDVATIAASIGISATIAAAMAARVDARADTRAWNNLPERIFAKAFDLKPGRYQIAATWLSAEGTPLPGAELSTVCEISDSNPVYLYLSPQTASR